ncbi:protein kinase domain containing protein [Stylonychia lemnae]|uniref:Protein kinase domain containing protein n=1 Tax=Stylonychia lemnae TaxID=5949 RepID=A0A078B057_STYLE|nr:protein kinase domain containing protein [Stylonychia lemnae]|eukprot:CDW86802.1 protein kinase domain containing protein [Stylonychia lemnae]
MGNQNLAKCCSNEAQQEIVTSLQNNSTTVPQVMGQKVKTQEYLEKLIQKSRKERNKASQKKLNGHMKLEIIESQRQDHSITSIRQTQLLENKIKIPDDNFLSMNINHPGKLKIMKFNSDNKNCQKDDVMKLGIRNYVYLQKLGCTNHYIQVSGCITDKQNSKSNNIFECLIKQKETPTEYQIAVLMKELLLSIQYCHTKQVSHKEIQPFNIECLDDLSDTMSQNQYFMAPERITGNLDVESSNNKRSDIWSAGVILYILICGRPPFEARTSEELLEKIYKSEFNFHGKEWDQMADAKNLIYEMLQHDPIERIDAIDAINHDFFNNILYNESVQNNFRAKRNPNIIHFLEFFYRQIQLKDQIQNFVNFMKQIPDIKKSFDKIFNGAQNLLQVRNGFSYVTGDIILAENLIKEILPQGFGDESHNDPSLKITVDNLQMYYIEFYQHQLELQLHEPLSYFEKVNFTFNSCFK